MKQLLFSFMIAVPVVSFSQEDSITQDTLPLTGRHIISIGYGTLTPDYLMDGYHPGRPTEKDYSNKGSFGVISISYKYKLTKMLLVGFTGTVEQQCGDWLDNEIPDGNVFDLQTTVKGAFVRTNYTFAGDVAYDYYSKGIFRTYLTAGFGVTYEFETDQYNPDFYNLGYQNGKNSYGPMRVVNNRAHINGYFSPVGLSVGRQICFFAEAGFGYKGVFNMGISYVLKSKSHKK